MESCHVVEVACFGFASGTILSTKELACTSDSNLAKIIDVECPRCGTQSRIPVGLRDVDTGEVVQFGCPRCGLDFEFET